MNSRNSKTGVVLDCPIAVITDHFVDVNKMTTTNTDEPIEIERFGIDIWESVFNSDFNCGEFATISIQAREAPL